MAGRVGAGRFEGEDTGVLGTPAQRCDHRHEDSAQRRERLKPSAVPGLSKALYLSIKFVYLWGSAFSTAPALPSTILLQTPE